MGKLDDIFWPHPFKSTGSAMTVSIVGDIDRPKVYAPGLVVIKQQIKDLISERDQRIADKLTNQWKLSLDKKAALIRLIKETSL